MNKWKQAVHGTMMVVTSIGVVQSTIIAPAFGQQAVNVVNTNSNGQKTMASSAPVVLPSDQTYPYAGGIDTAAPSSAILLGCQAQTGEFSTLATNGQITQALCDLTGKQIVLPYSVKEKMVRGAGTASGTAAVGILAAVSSARLYITDLSCFRSDAGTTAVVLTFNDSVPTVWILPNNGGGGGVTKSFETPLILGTANASFTFSVSSSLSTVYCNAQGFSGSPTT